MAHRNKMKELFEFGMRCYGCRERYCLKCFRVVCTMCRHDSKSKYDCKCKMIRGLIEEKLDEAKYLLVSKNTTSYSIGITMNYYLLLLHEGIDVYMKVVLHKTFDDIQKMNASFVSDSQGPVNYIELCFHINEGFKSRKKYVSKQTAEISVQILNDPKIIAVYYGEGMTKRHETCVDHLNRLLERREIRLELTDDLPKTFEKNEDPLLVISLIHSRPSSDVATTLSKIEERYYGRVILVLLHFKQGDMRTTTSEMIESFKVFEAVDYFIREDPKSIQNVADTVWLAIDNYHKKLKPGAILIEV